MKLLAKIGLFGLIAAGSATALYAEPAGGWLSPNGTSGGIGAASSASSSSSSTGGLPSQSLVDLQGHVHALHEQTRADSRHIQHLQALAHKEKDILKLNCVNDKLVQVKPQMNIADAAEAELEASSDASRMASYETVTNAAEAVRRLREEADQCIGEPVQTGGDSSNSFSGPSMTDDPYKGFGAGRYIIEAPGYASPFN